MNTARRVAAVAAALGLAGAISIAAARKAPKRARPAVDAGPPPPTLVKGTASGGTHWRIVTSKGPVHIWKPAGFRLATAGLVLYAHGFGHNADGAWNEHKLADQFRASKRNALFIVPEVRSGSRDRLRWTHLGALIQTVRAATGVPMPWGEIVAVGHSGAFRTMARWLDYAGLDTVILLDGLYGAQPQYGAWLSRNRRHRLIMTSSDTLERSEPFARKHRALTYDLLPERTEDLGSAAHKAQFVYFRAQHSHMALVEDGQVIPALLGLTTVPSL